jgi:glutaconate CoA-transferase subunit B
MPNVSSARDYTTQELMAAFLAREIADGERVAIGANLPVARAAVLLAHLMHGPNMRVFISQTFTNLTKEPVLEPFHTLTDFRAAKWAESYLRHDESLDRIDLLSDTFVVGAVQVDKYGNSNLIGVGKDYAHLTFRGPGGVGTGSLGDHVSRYYLFVNSHKPTILVDKCDFVSCVGWATGGRAARSDLGLPGGGPKYCITPLAILDFDEDSKRMRLKSLHPGVGIADVVENTGFELVVPDNVPQTEPPTQEQIDVLRSRIDVDEMLRR